MNDCVGHPLSLRIAFCKYRKSADLREMQAECGRNQLRSEGEQLIPNDMYAHVERHSHLKDQLRAIWPVRLVYLPACVYAVLQLSKDTGCAQMKLGCFCILTECS